MTTYEMNQPVKAHVRGLWLKGKIMTTPTKIAAKPEETIYGFLGDNGRAYQVPAKDIRVIENGS